jgi:hypothetical protein
MDDALLQEAANPGTSSERLRQLYNQHPIINVGLSKNPATPPDILKLLSSNSSVLVREQVTENPNTPLKVLFHLGSQFPKQLLKNPALPLILLENPNAFAEIPTQALLKLLEQPEAPYPLLEWSAAHTSIEVRRKTAQNAHTPIEALERLAGDQDPSVREAIYKNKSAAPVIQLFWRMGASLDLSSASVQPHLTVTSTDLERLASGGGFARYLVSRHPNTTEAALQTLAQNFQNDVPLRLEIAQHPKTPRDVLRVLLVDIQAHIRALAVKHANVPKDFVETLYRLGADETLAEYKKPDLKLSKDELLELLEGASHWVKTLIARHPNVPVAILQQLSTDPALDLKLAIAHNPTTPNAILEQFAATYYSDLLAIVATHPNLSEKTLNYLWNEHRSGAEIRRAIVQHPQAPENFLHKAILWVEDKKLRQKASYHPNAPKDLIALLQKAGASADLSEYTQATEPISQEELQKLIYLGGFAKSLAARHPQLDETNIKYFSVAREDWLQISVACHPKLPKEIQQVLSQSERIWVREALGENPNSRAEVLEKLSKDPEDIVRWAVSRNPFSPTPVLRQLTQDRNERVRGSAFHSLQQKK